MGGKKVKEPSLFLLGQIRAGRPKKIKDKLKEKKIEQNIAKLNKIESDKELKKKRATKYKNETNSKNKNLSRTYSKNAEVVDVCTLIKKCSIDEISKYLLKQSKKKGFPD